MVDWIKDKLDSFSSKMFPLKEKCLNVLYNMIAWTYIDSRNVTNIQDLNLKKIYLKHHLGIRVAELPRDVDIGWIKAIDRKEALKTYRRFVPPSIFPSFRSNLKEYLNIIQSFSSFTLISKNILTSFILTSPSFLSSISLQEIGDGVRAVGAGLAFPRAVQVLDRHPPLRPGQILREEGPGHGPGGAERAMDAQFPTPVHPHRDMPELQERGEGGRADRVGQLEEARPRLPRRFLQTGRRDNRRHRHGEAARVRRDRRQATAHIEPDARGHEGGGGFPLEADGGGPGEEEDVRDARLQTRGQEVQTALQEEDNNAATAERSGY